MKYTLLDKAQKHCEAHGYRFTEPRERVLKILMEAKKPLGAYEVLKRLSSEIDNPKPPTVYRAIQFWHQEGFIHSIDSLKAYIACLHGHHIGQAQFLICHQCNFVKEMDYEIDLTLVTAKAQKIRFNIHNCTIELKGLCAICRAEVAAN